MTFIPSINDHSDLYVAENKDSAIHFAVEHFIATANKAIAAHGNFTVALSGGSTPKAIYESLASPVNKDKIDWSKVVLYWSDERSVAPTDKESNFHMAMEAGLKHLPLSPKNIHRMIAEDQIELNATEYNKLIPFNGLDLVMLGMGDDGHTASLFPFTHGLNVDHQINVVANYVPYKHTWRMSFTYHCINHSKHIAIYVLGESKAEMIKKVLKGPRNLSEFPIQGVGTPANKALWITDTAAASKLHIDS